MGAGSVTPNTQYTLAIKAHNAAGFGPLSAAVNFTYPAVSACKLHPHKDPHTRHIRSGVLQPKCFRGERNSHDRNNSPHVAIELLTVHVQRVLRVSLFWKYAVVHA